MNPITEFGDKVIYSKRFNRPIKIKKTIPNHDLIPEDLKTEPNKTDSTNTTNITTPPIPINENNRTETPTNTTNTSVLNPANSTNTTVNITIPNASPQ